MGVLIAGCLRLGHVLLFPFIFLGCQPYSCRPGLIYRGLAGASLPPWTRYRRVRWDLTGTRSVPIGAYGNRKRYWGTGQKTLRPVQHENRIS